MDVDKDMYINMLVLLYRTLLKTFKVIWSPVADTNSKQDFRVFDGSLARFGSALRKGICQMVHRADYGGKEAQC